MAGGAGNGTPRTRVQEGSYRRRVTDRASSPRHNVCPLDHNVSARVEDRIAQSGGETRQFGIKMEEVAAALCRMSATIAKWLNESYRHRWGLRQFKNGVVDCHSGFAVLRKYEVQIEAHGVVGEELRTLQSHCEVLEVARSRVIVRRPLRSASVNVRSS